MPDYSQGKIYTIRFHNSNEIYVGSTVQPLAVRFGGHKRNKIYTALSKLIIEKYNDDWSVCYYELYENYSCNSKEELNKKEGEIIRKFKEDENYICINKLIAGRTQEEYIKVYQKENKEKVNEKSRRYYEKNKDKINEKHKLYKEDNKEKISENNRKYYEGNKEKISENNKKYYDINKKKIRKKIECECGSCLCKCDLNRHFKTKKHQDYIASKSCIT